MRLLFSANNKRIFIKPVATHITSTCIINSSRVYKNGEIVLSNDGKNSADFFLSIYKSLNVDYARFYKMDLLSKLGWLASEVLLKDGFDKEKYPAEEFGMVIANANSSLDTDIKYIDTVKSIASPSVFVYTLPNIMMGEICIRNHFKGETAFFVSEVPDTSLLETYVNGLFDENQIQACICGWVDLLGDAYSAVLFLVEKNNEPGSLFTKDNLDQTLQLNNLK